jgi:beta-carotene ketolase (CrtW type)
MPQSLTLTSSYIRQQIASGKGVLIALLIMALWTALLAFNLNYPIKGFEPVLLLLILLQTHLFTGLFITAHDAMHGTISTNKRINNLIGAICLAVFALNSWKRMLPKHHEHHRYAGTEDDPDYGPPPFWLWFFKFVKTYVRWYQIVGMAIIHNIAKLWIPEINLVLFYIVPSILSMLQLFYFGTYLPHRGEHAAENPHRARSQSKNHLWAFISCYFFGYHYEHHDAPGTPWWLLYARK